MKPIEILLVEDNPGDARLTREALMHSKVRNRLHHARDGEEAWFRGDTEDYGAVILDLGLPGMDGLAVLKRWRSNGRHMPVLILTARASWAERVDGIDAGAPVTTAQIFPDDLETELISLNSDGAGLFNPAALQDADR